MAPNLAAYQIFGSCAAGLAPRQEMAGGLVIMIPGRLYTSVLENTTDYL